MIVKKIKKIDEYHYETSIPYISVEYLKEIESFFHNNGILTSLYEKSYTIINLIEKTKNKDIFIKLINQITIYNEGTSSSKIENIFLSNTNTENQNKDYLEKIFSYINEVQKINQNEGIVNESILIKFHDNIEPDKTKGIRDNTPQYIGDHKAPISEHLKNAMKNFWEIYYGDGEYDDIDLFVRWAFQHLLFETIHPFDDGNGRSGRILNFFFYLNQKAKLFDNFLFETSTNIFHSKEEYGGFLSSSRIYIKNKIYSSEWKKSISRDCIFCNYMFEKLIEKMNWIIDHIKIIENNIDAVVKIFNNNHTLKKYSKKLLDFFASNPVFNRTYFVKWMNVAEATASKLINEIESLNLINIELKGEKNLQYKKFIPFYQIEKKI